MNGSDWVRFLELALQVLQQRRRNVELILLQGQLHAVQAVRVDCARAGTGPQELLDHGRVSETACIVSAVAVVVLCVDITPTSRQRYSITPMWPQNAAL